MIDSGLEEQIFLPIPHIHERFFFHVDLSILQFYSRSIHYYKYPLFISIFQCETVQQELESYKEKVEELTVDLEILKGEISDKG